jgi:hypothetical protein
MAHRAISLSWQCRRQMAETQVAESYGLVGGCMRDHSQILWWVLCLFLGQLCIVFDSIGNAERPDGVGIEPHELLFCVGVES